MKSFSGSNVGSECLLWHLESSEMVIFLPNVNLGDKFFLVLRSDYSLGKTVLSFVGFAISSILPVGCLSKIIKYVVSLKTVSMVYLVNRPSPRHIKPRKPVSPVFTTIHPNANVSFPVEAASGIARLANSSAMFWGYFPSKYAGERIVIQDFDKAAMSNFLHEQNYHVQKDEIK